MHLEMVQVMRFVPYLFLHNETIFSPSLSRGTPWPELGRSGSHSRSPTRPHGNILLFVFLFCK